MTHLSDAPLKGRLLAFAKNIRLGRKGLPGTNSLAYFEKSQLTTVKSFITLATGVRKIGVLEKEARLDCVIKQTLFASMNF